MPRCGLPKDIREKDFIWKMGKSVILDILKDAGPSGLNRYEAEKRLAERVNFEHEESPSNVIRAVYQENKIHPAIEDEDILILGPRLGQIKIITKEPKEVKEMDIDARILEMLKDGPKESKQIRIDIYKELGIENIQSTIIYPHISKLLSEGKIYQERKEGQGANRSRILYLMDDAHKGEDSPKEIKVDLGDYGEVPSLTQEPKTKLEEGLEKIGFNKPIPPKTIPKVEPSPKVEPKPIEKAPSSITDEDRAMRKLALLTGEGILQSLDKEVEKVLSERNDLKVKLRGALALAREADPSIPKANGMLETRDILKAIFRKWEKE